MSRFHYFILSLLLIICASGSVFAFRYGMANIYYYKVKNTLDSWSESPDKSSIEQYWLAKSDILQANDFHPQNAYYLDIMGQVYQWGAIFEFEDKQEALNSAKALYLQSTQLRPLWPDTWASLVMVKWRLQQFDDEMLLYLGKANNLGPQKPVVNILFSHLGLALYTTDNKFFFNIRNEFKQRLAKGLVNPLSRKSVVGLIKQYQSERAACRWLATEHESVKVFIPNCK